MFLAPIPGSSYHKQARLRRLFSFLAEHPQALRPDLPQQSSFYAHRSCLECPAHLGAQACLPPQLSSAEPTDPCRPYPRLVFGRGKKNTNQQWYWLEQNKMKWKMEVGLVFILTPGIWGKAGLKGNGERGDFCSHSTGAFRYFWNG